MSKAYKCDNCGEFVEGDVDIQLDLDITIGESMEGLLGSMFGSSDAGRTLDLCSQDCASDVDLNTLRNEVFADIEDRDAVPQPETVDVDGEKE